jgi:cellulose biosynthesis protein BcsQ
VRLEHMSDRNNTQLVTFYSYKGGVGRTMALANVACQLANKHGRDVIVVDWDLEAPGLHYYYRYQDEDLQERKGLLDYLLDFAAEVAKGEDGREPLLDDYLMELKSEEREKIRFGSVRLMPCGRMDGDYMARVQAMDWGRFYGEQEGFRIVETLKARWRKAADLILIDARAGQADIGATPTIQVPDAVVLLFTANRQNVQGVAEIARHLKRHPDRTVQGLSEPRLLMIPARIFVEEDRCDRWMEDTAKPIYRQLLDEKVLAVEDQPKGLEQCILAVDPRYTFEEALPILSPESVRSYLKDAYAQLAEAILALYEGRAELWSGADVGGTLPRKLPLPSIRSAPAQDEASLREALMQAANRGDEYSAANHRLGLATIFVQQSKFAEAEPLLQASLTFYRSQGDKYSVGTLLYSLGVVKHSQEELNEAMEYFAASNQVWEEIGSSVWQGAALMHMGALAVEHNDLGQAMKFYKQAVDVYGVGHNSLGQTGALAMVAEVCRSRNDVSKARTYLEEAIAAAKKAGNSDLVHGLEHRLQGIDDGGTSAEPL